MMKHENVRGFSILTVGFRRNSSTLTRSKIEFFVHTFTGRGFCLIRSDLDGFCFVVTLTAAAVAVATKQSQRYCKLMRVVMLAATHQMYPIDSYLYKYLISNAQYIENDVQNYFIGSVMCCCTFFSLIILFMNFKCRMIDILICDATTKAKQ